MSPLNSLQCTNLFLDVGYRKLVGTTELTRKVPVTFEKDAFESGTGLQTITMMDLGIGNISYNIFPSNLSTL